MKRTNLFLLILVPAILLIAATTAYQLEFRVQEGVNLNEIIATWKVSDMSSITEFELERKMNSSNWVVIHKVQITDAILASGKKEFQYTDSDVYKTGETQAIAEYKIRAKHRDNTSRELTAQVQYTTSAVRRTWGSIKSMFQ
jgi:cation transport regulator ChaB